MTTKCRAECADQVLSALIAIVADYREYRITVACDPDPLIIAAEAAIAAATKPPRDTIKGERRIHGVTCGKAPHTREGMLHGEDDDRPYDVDGAKYCGRCHLHITTEEIAFAALVARRGVAYCAGCDNTFPMEELRKHEDGMFCANCRPFDSHGRYIPTESQFVGWSDLRPLEIRKFRQWFLSHGER